MPKPMIPICGKSIMEHNIEKIYKYVSEIIIVVKYKKEVIIDALKENYK
jgi:NDP-sugar pyrophosphorylase family protein